MTQPDSQVKNNHPNSLYVYGLTGLALIAFAWNSIFCRMALRQTEIGPYEFTATRLIAGAVVLSIIVWIQNRRTKVNSKRITGFGSVPGAISLLVYATCFSLAYVSLPSGLGALLLFGAVQFTMISSGLFRGERLIWQQWLGFTAAVLGLLVLLWPRDSQATLTSEQLPYAALMLVAGFSWGVYSLLAKGSGDPTVVTAGNFVKAAGLAAILFTVLAVSTNSIKLLSWDWRGFGYAILSGAITSGIGYAIWYQALKNLQATVAATVQLSVPVLVGITGVLILGETINATLIGSAILILGGVAMVIRFTSK